MNSRLRIRMAHAARRAHRRPMDMHGFWCAVGAIYVVLAILFGDAFVDWIDAGRIERRIAYNLDLPALPPIEHQPADVSPLDVWRLIPTNED